MSRPNIPSYESLEPMFKDVFKSLIITETRSGSKYCRLFSEKIKQYLNVRNAMLLPNCTTGLMVLLQSIGGGNILTPSYTYSATANAIKWSGANPLFVDVDETCTINPSLVQESIGKGGISAILAVNLYGNPCNIGALEKISRKTKVPLIFDSAHAFGAEYEGKRIGCFGMAEVFSLAAAKLVTSGEGGLITTDDAILADELEPYKWAGCKGNEYNSICFGLSGRLPELSSVLGIGSLKRLETELKARDEIAEIYKIELEGIADISFVHQTPNTRQTNYIFPIFTKYNRELENELESKDIECRTNYFCPPIHKMIAFSEYRTLRLPVTEKKANTVLALPIHGRMSKEDGMEICKTIKSFLKGKRLL